MICCLSGGAVGSDTLFATIGNETGLYTTLAYSFSEHNSLGGIKINLSDNDLYKYMYAYRKISSQLGRAVSNKPYIQKLILRDFFQIYGRKNKNTELVIAIGELENNSINVKVGTGYAVRIAMNENIPLILIDKSNEYKFKFFDYSINNWRPLLKSDLFYIKSGFTGIGSREINIDKAKAQVIKLLNYILK